MVDFFHPTTGLDSPALFAAHSEKCCQFTAVPRIWQPAILSPRREFGNLGNPYCWFWLPESCPPVGSISLCLTPSAGAVLVSGSPSSPGRSHHIPSGKEKPCRLSPSSLRVLHFSAPMGFPCSSAREALGLALPLTLHTDMRILCLSWPGAGAQSCGAGHCLCSSCSPLEAATLFLEFDPRQGEQSTITSDCAALPVLKEKNPW